MSVYDRLNRLRQRYERTYGKSYKRSAARRKDEVEMLSLVAKLYWDTGSDGPENNWSQLLKAHALYNSCAVRCSGLEMEGYIEKACLVQNRYRHGYSTVQLFNRNGYPTVSVRQLQKLRSSHKELIQGIRAQVRSDLKPMRVEVRRMKTNPAVDRMSEWMRRIALVCNERMVGFAKRVVQDAIDIVGAPPCSFTVAGKGSLARGEATPYSDLEFFIIVEKKTTAETKKYFMHLSMNIYFLIGNMQETKLKYMNIGELDWFDDQEMNGVKIDGLQRGAGNIPTGNGVTDRKNKYINSPEEFQEKYKILYANPDPEEALQGDDSAMVAFTTNIYSHTHPGSRPTDFLGDFNEKQKAIPMTQERRRLTQEMLERDMEKYKFDPSTFCEDGAIEVKSKIYRFPSLMILDLSVLHEIHASSSWEALDQLYSRGKISHSKHKLLRNLLALASYLRMCTYLYHNSQREFMVLAQNAMDELNLLPTCRPGKPCYLASRNAVVNAVHCMRDLCSH